MFKSKRNNTNMQAQIKGAQDLVYSAEERIPHKTGKNSY